VNKGKAQTAAFYIMTLLLIIAVYHSTVRSIVPQSAPAGAKPLTIGLSVSSLHSLFMEALVSSAEEAASIHDNTRLIVINANFDAATQLNQLDNLIIQRPDAIILNALDSDSVVPAVMRANAANIPVFTIDLGTNGGKIESALETDNVAIGREAAKFIAEKLRARYGEYVGNVIDLMGSSGMTSTKNREKGFAEQMALYPGIKIIARQMTDLDQEQALNIMTTILQGYSQIDAVFSANDSVALGVSRAVHQTGRFYPLEDKRHIIICSVDGTRPVLAEIRQGKIDATISQNPVKMAGKAVDLTVELVRSGKTPPQRVFYPHILITKDNIDSSAVKEYGIWSDFTPYPK